MARQLSMKTAAIAKMPDGLCAGCGRPIGVEPILKLANDAVVHFRDYDCLIQYGKLREVIGSSTGKADDQTVPAADHRIGGDAHRVGAADALDDFAWFKAHPERHFRVRADGDVTRSGELIRRRPQPGDDPDILLRAFSPATELLEDTDGAIAVAWFRATYPGWPLEKVRKTAAKLLKAGAS